MAEATGARLVGRSSEQEILAEALTSSAGTAVLVRGAAGIGKTALLDWAAEQGDRQGARVLRVTGVETESEHAFAALHQLTWPLMPLADELTAAQRGALERVLGMADAAPPSASVVSVAVLTLLESAAAREPLLLIVDDLHWVDASSAGVFAFVQRRLGPAPITMVGAARPDGTRVDTAGARVLNLPPLDEEQALELLAERRPELSTPGRRQVVEHSAGYPLALVELPPDLFKESGSGRPVGGIPLAERLERTFGRQLRQLTPGARRVLLLTVLAGAGAHAADLVHSAAEVAGTPVTAEDRDVVAGSGLAAPDPVTAALTFRHPLVREALLNSTPRAELRQAHAALSAALPEDDPRHVMHLAAATLPPDDTVAALLDEAAMRIMRRQGAAEAAVMLARAAELGTDPAARNRRLTDAAVAATRGGRPELAERLIGLVERDELSPAHEVLYAYTLSYLRALLHADYSITMQLFPKALRELGEAGNAPWAAAIREIFLYKAIFSATYTGCRHLWTDIEPVLEWGSEQLRLCADLWRDPARGAHDGARRFADLVAALESEPEGEAIWPLLWSAVAIDAFGDYDGLWQRIAAKAPDATLAFLGLCTAHDDVLRGHWDRCLRISQEGAAEAGERANLLNSLAFLVITGYVHAGRGDAAALEELGRSLGPYSRGAAPLFVEHQLGAARALCRLSLGDYEGAYHLAAAITPPGEFPPEAVQFQYVFLTLVESAVHIGLIDQARLHVRAGEDTGIATISQHHAFVLAAARAFTADDAEVGAACEAAYAVPGSEKWPFELARVRLAHGTWLRRGRSRQEAREQLLQAHAAFTRLKAEPWIRRAAEELRAGGYDIADEPASAPQTPATQGPAALTAQERRIAELAAKGLTNKEIGARLRLSPRTVGAHLYKIFPKLGVTSRGGLADALRKPA
ncbi:ATP-binding protein [Streptomyces sp. NPDC052023]|uniref:ATP-binding protein n=1 Tax=Streptomyces sp. NPDC052023 TaxID=3365681 RepID=UPI0037CE0A78